MHLVLHWGIDGSIIYLVKWSYGFSLTVKKLSLGLLFIWSSGFGLMTLSPTNLPFEERFRQK